MQNPTHYRNKVTAAFALDARRKIVSGVSRLLDDPEEYARMSRSVNPYGDGQACRRIVERMLEEDR